MNELYELNPHLRPRSRRWRRWVFYALVFVAAIAGVRFEVSP